MSSIKNLWRGLLFASLLALTSLAPAWATILQVAGEDLDVVPIGGPTVSTNSSFFRTGYAREALSVNAANASDPATMRFLLPTFTNQTTVWIHAVVYSGGTSTQNGTQWLCVFGSDGVCRLVLRSNGGNGGAKISKRTSAAVFTDLVTCTAGAFPIAAIQKIDLFLNYAVSGHVTFYVNGVNVCDYAGDVTTDGVTAVNQVYFASGNTGAALWSEMIVSTTDTRDMNLWTCYPAANGTNMTWTGSYTNVNGTTWNDPGALFTGTNNLVAEFTCPTLPAGAFTVPMVSQSARTQIGGTGPQNYRWIIRPAGFGDFDNGSDIPGTLYFNNTYNYWPSNPNTSAPWGTGDLGTGINFGLKSRP